MSINKYAKGVYDFELAFYFAPTETEFFDRVQITVKIVEGSAAPEFLSGLASEAFEVFVGETLMIYFPLVYVMDPEDELIYEVAADDKDIFLFMEIEIANQRLSLDLERATNEFIGGRIFQLELVVRNSS